MDGEGDAASVNSQASVASGGDDKRPAAPMAAPTAANVIDPDVYDRRAEGSGDGVDPDRLASSAPAEVMEKVVTRRGRGLKTEERSNDPTVVPRRGAFFMHDDRFDAKEERARVGHEDGDGQARRGGRNAPRGGRAHDSPTAAAEHTPSNTPSPRTPDVGRGAEGRAPRGGGAPRPRALWDDAADRQPDRWTHDRFTPADSTGAAAGGGGDKASPREHHTGGKRRRRVVVAAELPHAVDMPRTPAPPAWWEHPMLQPQCPSQQHMLHPALPPPPTLRLPSLPAAAAPRAPLVAPSTPSPIRIQTQPQLPSLAAMSGLHALRLLVLAHRSRRRPRLHHLRLQHTHPHLWSLR